MKRKGGVICLLIAALFFLVVSNKRAASVKTGENGGNKQVENRFGSDGKSEEEGNGQIRKQVKRDQPGLSSGRSKGKLLGEVQRVFGQAEAARARKLAERFSDGNGSYLYVVEPPSKGEVQTVKAQIADLGSEIAQEDREDFDKQLEEKIDSYDPYGEKGRKVFLLTVPVDKAGRMSGEIVEADDLDEFRKKFISGEP